MRSPSRSLRSLSLILAPLLAAAPLAAQSAVTAEAQNGSPAPPPAAMARILESPTLRGTSVGILAVDAATGEVLVAHHADELFPPASVNKIFTAAAALWRLGATFSWQTPIAYRGERIGANGETIAGDLWVVGRGAPDTVEEQLWLAARAIRNLGIERIDGDLVVDDRFFDAERFGNGWPGGIQARESYHAPISALMANYGAVREGDGWAAVPDATLHFGERLGELLGLAGVELTGRVRTPNVAERGAVPPSADADPANSRTGLPDDLNLLYTIHSEPLGRLVLDVNKFSNNVMAEVMLKAVGAIEYGPPGTATKGLAVVARFRSELLGTPLDAYVQADASGLSPLNRVTPREVVALLRHAYTDFHLGPELVSSLKISGLDGFNPRPFRDPPLLGEMRLKSGHIRGVNTLAGYAHTNGGRAVAFCLMINGHRAAQWEVDERVAELSQVILSSF